MIRLFYTFMLYMLFAASSAHAEDADIEAKLISLNSKEVELQIIVPEEWKLYSQDPGDIGEKFTIHLSNAHNISSYQVEWPEALEATDNIAGIKFDYRYYTGAVVIPIKLSQHDESNPFSFELNLDYNICHKSCLRKSQVIKFASASSTLMDVEYLYAIIFALIGGFILNFMPCVLPVLSLKLNSMMHGHRTKENCLYIMLGIAAAFNMLFVVTMFLKMAGHTVGWGLQFQSPYYLSFLVLSLMFFAIAVYKDSINFLPSNIQTYLSNYSHKKESINSFITGIIATLLAVPCTAPFLGGAVGFALSRGILEIFIIFNAIGIGFATPYILLVLYPKALRILPTPGAWMVWFKKLLAALLALTAAWFLFVLSKQVDMLYLLEFVVMSGIVMFLLFAVKLSKAIRFYSLVGLLCIMVIFNVLEESKLERTNTQQDDFIAKIAENVEAGHTVLVNVTADWCITCKYNTYVVIKSRAVQSFIKERNVVVMELDYTNQNPKIFSFITQYNRYGIPFTIVFSPKHQDGIVLSELLSEPALLDAMQ